MGLPGRSLELRGDAHPRGMTAHDRTRLTGRLFFSAARELTASKRRRPRALAARAGEGRWLREREDQEKNQEKTKRASGVGRMGVRRWLTPASKALGCERYRHDRSSSQKIATFCGSIQFQQNPLREIFQTICAGARPWALQSVT